MIVLKVVVFSLLWVALSTLYFLAIVGAFGGLLAFWHLGLGYPVYPQPLSFKMWAFVAAPVGVGLIHTTLIWLGNYDPPDLRGE